MNYELGIMNNAGTKNLLFSHDSCLPVGTALFMIHTSCMPTDAKSRIVMDRPANYTRIE